MNDFLIEVFKDTKKLYTTDEALKASVEFTKTHQKLYPEEDKIDISNLEKGTYTIFITTKSNLTDFSELNDNLIRSLKDRKATINNKNYQLKLDTKNGNNIELIVS